MAELFKFRCYQCSKLLGASPSKIGTVVRCPRCAAELVVPPPPDEIQPDDEAGGVRLEDLGLRLEPEPMPEPRPQPSDEDRQISALLSKAGGVSADDAPEPPPASQPPGAEPPTESSAAPFPEVRRRPRSRLDATRGRESASRRNDVSLPRTAVIAWALTMLLAVGFAFAAGMLIGHFLWR